MTSGQIIFLELLLVMGLVLGFGIWQLMSLRRLRREKDRRAREQQD